MGWPKKYMKGEPEPDTTPEKLGLPDDITNASMHKWVQNKVDNEGMSPEAAANMFLEQVNKLPPQQRIQALQNFEDRTDWGRGAIDTGLEALGMPIDAGTGLGRMGGGLAGGVSQKLGLPLTEEQGANVGGYLGGGAVGAYGTALAGQGGANVAAGRGWTENPADLNPRRQLDIGAALKKGTPATDGKPFAPTPGAQQLRQTFDAAFATTQVSGVDTNVDLLNDSPALKGKPAADVIQGAYDGDINAQRWLMNEMRNNPSGAVAKANNGFLLNVRRMEAENAAKGGHAVTDINYGIDTPDRNLSSLQSRSANRRLGQSMVDTGSAAYTRQALSDPRFKARTGTATTPSVRSSLVSPRTPGDIFPAGGIPRAEAYRTPTSVYKGDGVGRNISFKTPKSRGYAALAALLLSGWGARQYQQAGRHIDPYRPGVQDAVRNALEELKQK